jgi:hypothetical protein
MAIDQSDIDDLEREIEGYRKAATPEAVQVRVGGTTDLRGDDFGRQIHDPMSS